jgi:hypothetical protein
MSVKEWCAPVYKKCTLNFGHKKWMEINHSPEFRKKHNIKPKLREIYCHDMEWIGSCGKLL